MASTNAFLLDENENILNLTYNLKSVQVIVRLHIFPIFLFLAKMLPSLSRNEIIGKNMQADQNLNGL